MRDLVVSIVCLGLFAGACFAVLRRRMRVGRLHALPSTPHRPVDRDADDGDGDGDAGDDGGDGGDGGGDGGDGGGDGGDGGDA